MIRYPIRSERSEGEVFSYLIDASDRIIAGGLSAEDADEIVARVNARGRNRKQQIEESLRQSDLTAQAAGRDDVEYGHHESLPRGEHVARLRK